MSYTKENIDGSKYVSTIDEQVNRELEKIEQGINTNESELNDESLKRQLADEDLQGQLTQILEETDLNPNKDPEVTNARGDYDTLDLRLNDSDVRVGELEDNANNKSTISLSNNAPIFDSATGLDDGDTEQDYNTIIEDAFVDTEIEGMTLVNSVKAIEGSTLTVVDNQTNIYLQADGSLNTSLAYIYKQSSNDRIGLYIRFKSSSTASIDGLTRFNGASGYTVALPSGSKEVYYEYDAAGDNDGYFRVRADADGDLILDSAIVINKTALGLEDLTEDEMNNLLTNYIDGMKSVESPVIQSVGKNLVSRFEIGGISPTTGLDEVQTLRMRSVGFIKCENNTSYNISGDESYTWIFNYYDINNEFIGYEVGSSITTPSNCAYFRVRSGVNGEDNKEAHWQIEKDSTATTYEPYKTSILSSQETLRRVPNGTKDKIYRSGGKWYKETNVAEYVLESGDITALITSYNLDYTSILLPVGAGVQNLENGGYATIQGFTTQVSASSASYNSLTNAYKWSGYSNINIILLFTKGTYASLAEAQADLAGTKIQYQLATPIIEEITVDGALEAYKNGTMYLSSDTITPPTTITYPLSIKSAILSHQEETLTNSNKIVTVDSKIEDSFYADLDAYYGNTKLVDDFQDASNWTGGLGTKEVDRNNVKIGTQSYRLTNTSSTFSIVYLNNIDLDLTTLNNGEYSSDEDFVLIPIYISDVSVVDNVIVDLGYDSTYSSVNRVRLILGSGDYTLNTGWNYIKFKKSDATFTGSGSLDTVRSLAIQWSSNVSTSGEYVSFQSIQLVKKDPLEDYPNPFQKFGKRDFVINRGEWFVGEEFGKVVIKNLSGAGVPKQYSSKFDYFGLYGNKSFKDFMLYTEMIMPKAGFLYGFGWADTITGRRNSIYVAIDSNNIYFAGHKSGVYFESTKSSIGGIAGDAFDFKISKSGSKFKLHVNKNRELVTELVHNVPEFEGLRGYLVKFNSYSSTNEDSITLSASITQIPHAHHADVAEVAKGLVEQPYFEGYLSATQSLSNATIGTILIDTVIENNGDFTLNDNGTITINKKGKYLVVYQTTFGSNTSGFRQIYIDKNTSSLNIINQSPTSGTATRMEVSNVSKFDVGDYVTCKNYQTSGGSLDTVAGSSTTKVTITKIG